MKDASTEGEFYDELCKLALPDSWQKVYDSEDGKIQDYGVALCNGIISMYEYLSKAYNDWKKSNK